MSTKFNIYYSLSATGPWELGNPTPLDREEGLQRYTVSGLNTNSTYFFSIVGGQLDEGNNFLPILSQPVGPVVDGAGGVQTASAAPVTATTFSPNITADTKLGHQFTVTLV